MLDGTRMTALAPQELSFADEAPWQFDATALLHATPAEVWSVFTDNQSWTVWFKNCRSCATTSEAEGGVGSTRLIDVSGLRVNERFIAWEQQRQWAFTAIDMRMSFATAMVERATFQQMSDATTRVDYRIAVQPTWWARPLRRLLAGQVSKSFATSFRQLDAYLSKKRAGQSLA